MFRRIHILVFACAAILTISAVTFAQNAPISGTVSIKNADGSVTPLEGATVEVFRTDTKASGPVATTDKRGGFVFAGLQVSGTYVLSISAPGAKPTFLPDVKPGRDNLKFELEAGDGQRLTPEEVREVVAIHASGGKLTEEQKKAQAEIEAKRKEVEARNAKIVEETKIIEASLKEGNEAFGAKNWDLAVARYDAGIAANPTFAGSAPVLMNNKGATLRQRAVQNYNENVKNPDVSAKVAAMTKVRADLGEAVESHHKAWSILKNAPAGELADAKVKEAQMNQAVAGATESFRLMAQTEQVDETKVALAKELIPEYQKIETDSAKKESSKLILGDLYRVVGDADNAIAEYRKVVEASPDNLDGLAGLGLSLVNAGYINDNKEQLQEGANYLQKFASAAPDSHKFKNDAVGLIESLKAEQKITPQKVAAPARRRNN